jgi:hypothetical protein
LVWGGEKGRTGMHTTCNGIGTSPLSKCWRQQILLVAGRTSRYASNAGYLISATKLLPFEK